MISFQAARRFLLDNRLNYEKAVSEFEWPAATDFNWALDWFDAELAHSTESRDKTALWIVDTAHGTETKQSFATLSRRSNRVANYLRQRGLKRGDALLVVLGNVVPLWETMLAGIKLGLVIIPATTLLTRDELQDRLERGRAKAVVAAQDQVAKFDGLGDRDLVRIVVGALANETGWESFGDAASYPKMFAPEGITRANDPMLLYFTSGTTAKPKLVLHSQRSYPVGALSTMYWLGLQPEDIHLNISSPGWAKHAWSCFFAPWNAGATIFVCNQPRFDAKGLLSTVERCGVTTLCAPPTVWRLLIQEDLSPYKMSFRELCGSGEPLNPEVIDQVKAAWGLTIRDGYGQTETTAMVGNSPGQRVKIGAMGRPLPGYHLEVSDPDGRLTKEGEIRLVLAADRPAGLMQGYLDEAGEASGADGAFYQTGDIVARDDDGYLTFIGRSDDVFKSSDYRISPFELESILLEHDMVAEAAVVPSPDPIRLAVPKAYVLLTDGGVPSRETALSIFKYIQLRLAPFQRIRRIAFVSELPKTISGKIRRVYLRRLEHGGERYERALEREFREDEFPGLQAGRSNGGDGVS